jgi:hypothetical protein
MTMLTMWLLFLIALAIFAVISVVIVGIVVSSQRRSDKRILGTSCSGVFLLIALAELFRRRLRLPYPPEVLARWGYSYVVAVGPCWLTWLSFNLAERIARRTAQLRPSKRT